jgi:protoporphyrinogen oxidase
MQTRVAIIGAGPAGLTAAYQLAKANIPVTVFEMDPLYVGGIARTVVYKGYCFDIGGHRFFSKAEEVENFWTEILPDDMLIRPRSSRIFYKGKFFSYPLKISEVLSKLGLFESFRCFLSYLKARLFPVKNPRTFADWVSNHFGTRLFSIFFKTYTEKVWGMSCDEISADWAAQRIKGLSFYSAIKNALFPPKADKNSSMIKTLINSFRYPRKGPGMLWEVCAEKIKNMQGSILMGATIKHCAYNAEQKEWMITYQTKEGELSHINAQHLISSAPLREVVEHYLSPTLSMQSLNAAKKLKYRDFLIVVLILKEKEQFSDNWIYIHDPSVDVGRIQNFKSWSPEMVPDANTCCYGMEYFCFENDGLWAMSDELLIQKATKELVKIGLGSEKDIIDGCVVRQHKAYPVYDDSYKENVAIIREEISKTYPTLHLVGRNGMHKYNNQDHAMMTAMLTVENIVAEKQLHDVWHVNEDAEYHEAGTAGEAKLELGVRQVPEKAI